MSDIKLLPAVTAFFQRQHGHFINGRAEVGAGETFALVNPASGETLATLRSADEAQADKAMRAAAEAFPLWRAMPPLQRGTLLLKLADQLEAQREELAQIESLCSGKTIQLARMLEVDQSVAFLRYFAGWAGKISGETLDVSLPSFSGEKYTAFTRREPTGVVVGIVPWNFSIMIGVWKLAAALVCGCTVVIKPSEYTPLTLLRLAELATACGFPAGVINIVNGPGAHPAAWLTGHAACAKISFTGSVATGKTVGRAAAEQGKRVTLELGGKNAALFLNDLSAEEMVQGILEAGYLNQGQICAAAECFWLPTEKIDEVMRQLAVRLQNIKLGSPLDEMTEMGPLANQAQFDKVLGLIAAAREEGDSVVYGGEALPGKGYFVQPAAVRVASADSRLMTTETFGPIGSFIAYENAEEAIATINASPLGLAASVWSQNISSALRYSERLQTGMVWINMHTYLDPALPFGGIKGSGSGREFGSAFIEDYTELKSVMLRY